MKIFAHRGLSGFYPENTMLSFKKCINLDLYGIELDVQKTKDNLLVVIHDEKVDRTFNSTGYVKNMTLKVAERYGKIDILVNHAEVTTNGNLFHVSVEAIEQVMRVYVTGAYICSKYCAPHMISEGASIVNIASTKALMSEPNSEAYAASKGALLSLTHALAASLGPKVRVNAISPGWIEDNAW